MCRTATTALPHGSAPSDGAEGDGRGSERDGRERIGAARGCAPSAPAPEHAAQQAVAEEHRDVPGDEIRGAMPAPPRSRRAPQDARHRPERRRWRHAPRDAIVRSIVVIVSLRGKASGREPRSGSLVDAHLAA